MQQKTSSKQSKKQEDFRWIDARSAIAMLAAVGTIFFACLACEEMDREETARLAETESAKQQTVVQAVQTTPEADSPNEESEVETVMLWDVPLEEDLQLFIVQLCENHHIEPSIVIAIIQRESSYRADVIGDNGEAFGLMQIWSKWHQERMNKLGVTDLLDPYQNVTVGVDYLAEMIDRGNGLEWALMAYNAGATGANKGQGSTYAAEVLEISESLGVIEYALD